MDCFGVLCLLLRSLVVVSRLSCVLVTRVKNVLGFVTRVSCVYYYALLCLLLSSLVLLLGSLVFGNWD